MLMRDLNTFFLDIFFTTSIFIAFLSFTSLSIFFSSLAPNDLRAGARFNSACRLLATGSYLIVFKYWAAVITGNFAF